MPVLAHAQSAPAPALKAAFLISFAKFTDWPADVLGPSDPIVLCSTDPAVAAALEETVVGCTVAGRSLIARHVTAGPSARSCSVLHVGHVRGDSSDGPVVSALGARDWPGILTVVDSEDVAAEGGVIGFYERDGLMRFAISLTAGERAHLKMSSKLLSLAKIVRE